MDSERLNGDPFMNHLLQGLHAIYGSLASKVLIHCNTKTFQLEYEFHRLF